MSNLFGNQQNSNSGSSLFGQQSNNNSNSGDTSQQQNTSSNVFGGGSKGLFQNFGSQDQNNSSEQSPNTGGFSLPKQDSQNNQSSQTTSLFGNLSTPNKSTSSSTQGPSLFGGQQTASVDSGSSTPTTSKPAFGAFNNQSTTPAGPPPTSNLFGNLGPTQKSSTSLFSSAQQNTPQSSAPSSTQQPASSLFGGQPSSSTAFGGNSAAPSSNSLFSRVEKPASEAPKEPPKYSFGQTSSSSQQPSNTKDDLEASNVRGATSNESTFSLPSANNSGTQSSGAATPATSNAEKPSLFGSTPSSNAPASNPFGALSQNKTRQDDGGQSKDDRANQSSSTSLFGNTTNKQDQGDKQQGQASNLFGATNQNQNQNQNQNHGQTQANKDQGQSSSLFSGASQKQSQGDGQQSQTSSLFGSVGQNRNQDTSSTAQNAEKAGAAASSLFANLGQNSNKSQSDGASKTQQTLAPTAPTTEGTGATSSASSAGGLFGAAAAKPSQDTSNKPRETTPGASALGNSTAGPAPSSQSRLKNKSMDDIITRWASDLSRYQKEFQTQAEKVSAWDRMLLENGNAVSKLYSKTYQAEKDTAEVQKQLSAVEGHQDELSHWLDRYEREVDDMMARQIGQGESLQGPDQERERTYKIASRVSERLDEMGKDLTSMIEEINEASATISKTSKPDDPLSQIVRVLNGHLSQLQLIDQGAAELRSKVDAAQKEGRQLGARANGSFGNHEAVDHFYRSYQRRG